MSTTTRVDELATADVHREHALLLLREMLRIRRFEEKAAEVYTLSKILGFLHLYIGEEAVAVGAMQALTPEDRILAPYTKGNFQFERTVTGWQERYALLDLRRKK